MNTIKTNPIEICFVASGDYAPFVATTALSIIENTNENVNFHVLTENFKEEDKRIISDFLRGVTIEFIDISEKLKQFEGVQFCWFKSYIPYARILIPELLPGLRKCIYMDIDIIVNCDIKDLWNVDLPEFALAAAKGYKDDFAVKEFGISPEHLYFNNGLLILNCEKWMGDGIAGKILKIAKETKLKFRYPTQDVFNIFFNDNNYISFPNNYNYMPKYMEHFVDPKIIHYVWDKPWKNHDCSHSDYFWKIAGKTPYYNFFLQKLEKNRVAKAQFADKLRKQIKGNG